MKEQKSKASDELKEEALEQVAGGISYDEIEKKKYQCPYYYTCWDSFDTEEELKRHISLEHTG
jgi:hypothetical protein